MLSGALLRLSLLGVIAGAGQSATSLTGTENVYTYTSALLNGTAGANITSSDFEINVGFNVVFAEKQVNITSAAMELMADAGGMVVDIIYVNVNPQSNVSFANTPYVIPGNLPAGSYHTRTNLTYTSASGSHMDQAISPSFAVNAYPECASVPRYSNVTSLSDPRYSSLHVVSPFGGSVVTIQDNTTNTAVVWRYIDTRNANGNGIQNLAMEILQQVSPNSGYQSRAIEPVNLAAASTTPDGYTTMALDFTSSIPSVSQGGLWSIRMNYTDAYAADVTYVSDPFQVTFQNGTGYSCSKCVSGTSCSITARNVAESQQAMGSALVGVLGLFAAMAALA